MGVPALEIDEACTVSLESQINQLALESNVISNVINSFRNVIPNITDDLKAMALRLVETDTLTKEFITANQHFSKLERKIPDASFVNYSKTIVSVPEGFSGNMLNYLKFLDSLSTEIFKEANSVLGDYNLVLSSFISNKQDKISLKDHTTLFERVKERREEILKNIKQFFPSTSVNSRKRFGDVVERFGELPEIMKVLEHLNRERKGHNLKEIANAVRESVEMLDIVIEEVKKNGVTNVSGNSAMNISQGAYELARFVELVAIYRNMVDIAVTSASRMIVQLEEII